MIAEQDISFRLLHLREIIFKKKLEMMCFFRGNSPDPSIFEMQF